MRSFWKIYVVMMVIAFAVMIAALLTSKPRPQPATWQALPPRDRPSRQAGVVPAKAKTAQPKTKPAGPQAAAPQFSVAGGVFTDSFTVELKAKSGAAVIRYTLDGSDPEESSPQYTQPISISACTVVRAVCFDPGLAPSAASSQTYTMLDEGLKSFSSNLPLVILNTFGQRVNSDEFVPVSARFIKAGTARTTLLGAADFEGRGELKWRGFSSLRNPKRSYTFKSREDGDKTKTSIFGLPADSDWVLYAPYSDKTLLRDALAYELGNKMGRYAPRTRFVEVFASRGGGRLNMRDYQGVYVFEEKISRGKERVNIAKLGPEDNTEPNITGGYIFKRDHEDDGGGGGGMFRGFRPSRTPSPGAEQGFYTGRGMHLFFVDPKERDLTAQQKRWLTGWMTEFENALYGPKFKSPTEGYAKYLDVDSFIDQFWIVEMSKNIDGFRYSCFMHKDRGGRLKMEPLWDWNLSFGNANYHEGWQPEDWYYPLLRDSEVSWFRRLAQDPDFYQRHIDRWAELRKNLFAPENILKRVDEMAAQLNETQARNFKRWPIMGRSVNPNYYVGNTYAQEIDWMKDWIKQRIAWIDRQFPAAPAFADGRAALKPGAKVQFNGSGKIYYTLDGSDPRAVGGGVSEKARLYESAFVLDGNTQLFARARNGKAWSAPVTTKSL